MEVGPGQMSGPHSFTWGLFGPSLLAGFGPTSGCARRAVRRR